MFKAPTCKVQVCVYFFTVVLINNCFSSIIKQTVNLIRNSEGDYFANPKGNCNAGACQNYNSTTVGGYCSSSSVCCSRCRCPTDAPTYVRHLKKCMSLQTFLETQIPNETYYLLGKPARSCSETCNDAGGDCVSQGHGFTNASTTLSIFSRLNVKCKTSSDTDNYQFQDNPAFYVGAGSWNRRCIGFKSVVKKIHCNVGHNNAVRRLCPCTGRYWLLENSCTYPINKISLINLNTEGKIRLASCGPSHTQSSLNCIVEQIIYVQGSHWIKFGKEEKDLFDVKTVPELTNAIELKWDKLDSHYDGVIGYIQIKCDLSGGIEKLSFLFKNNGSTYIPSSTPFITTEAMKASSIPTEGATPSSSTKTKGDFDKNKESNKSSSGAVVAGVTVSVVVLILICVIVAIIFYKKRRKRNKNEVEVAQSNPTYGKGPDHTLLLRQQEAKIAVNGNTMKAENTYEAPDYNNLGKKEPGYVIPPASKSNTYESVDPVSDSSYYCAKDVVNKMPNSEPGKTTTKTADKPEIDNVYCTPEVEDNREMDSDGNHVYNVLAQHEQPTNYISNGNEMLSYNILEREPITEQGYNSKGDEGLYSYAN